MRLVAFTVEGYRRFVEKTSVKLNGDLVAFVGPNEAGKSSLLRALSHLNDPRPFDPNERPRRTKAEPTLSWLFQLEELDREALAAIRDADGVERVRITKTADATTAWALEPKSPNRDRSTRTVARTLLTAHRGQPEFAAANDHDEVDFSFEAYDAAAEVLGLDIENYSAERRSTLTEAALQIRVVEHETTAEGDGEPRAAAEQERLAFEAVRNQLATGLEAVVETESQPSPRQQAIDALKPLVPALIVFSEADRELASQYELEDVAEDPPPALMHLAALASLDLVALRDEALAGAVADVATRRNTANATLLEAFNKSWNQQGIAIQVEVQGTLLHIQATTPEDSGLSDIGERSDGMRWFAALLAFAHGWTKKPILLVDEIERHLHYDAQADLIGVLSKQQFTSKVIFTTHSFGCLPYDLGTGVRVVQPVDGSRSRLENGFWKAGAGFSPLLASMGAAAMSFTPARHALIAEGPSDAILLPTLLREVCDEDHLDFQVAPGLASVAASDVADLESRPPDIGGGSVS